MSALAAGGLIARIGPSISPKNVGRFSYFTQRTDSACFAGQLGGAGDGGFDEADLIDQPFIERLLGGEDLARGDGVQGCLIVFELRPAAGDDRLEAFEAVVDERLHDFALRLAHGSGRRCPSFSSGAAGDRVFGRCRAS